MNFTIEVQLCYCMFLTHDSLEHSSQENTTKKTRFPKELNVYKHEQQHKTQNRESSYDGQFQLAEDKAEIFQALRIPPEVPKIYIILQY